MNKPLNKIHIFFTKEKKITFSGNADYIAKVNICPRLTIFFFLFAQNWHFSIKIDVDKNKCPFSLSFAQHDIITVYGNISPIFTFLCRKLTFYTKIDIDKNMCPFTLKFAQHNFITVLQNSLICPKTDTF